MSNSTTASLDASIVVDGVSVTKKRARDMDEAETDEHLALLYGTVERLKKKIDAIHEIVTSSPEPDQANVPPPPSGKSTVTIAPVVGARQTFTIASDHKNAILGKIRLKFLSWSDEIELTPLQPIAHRKGKGFPHSIRLGSSGDFERWVSNLSSFNVTVGLTIGEDHLLFLEHKRLLDHANAMIDPASTDSTALRFELYLIHAHANGLCGDADRPFASTDTTSQFRTGHGLYKLNNGKSVTAMFRSFDPKRLKETFFADVSGGKAVFKNIHFREDVLSSHVLKGDGAFRFVVRATHPALRDLSNFTALSPAFYVGTRTRALAKTKIGAELTSDPVDDDAEDAADAGDAGGDDSDSSA